MLSKEAVRQRNRISTISLQVTILVWFVECFASILLVVTNLVYGCHTSWIMMIWDSTIWHVIIPACYLIKTEETKAKLYRLGWFKFFTNLLPYKNKEADSTDDEDGHTSPNRPPLVNDCSGNELGQDLEQNLRVQMQVVDEDDENWILKINLFDEQGSQSTEREKKNKALLNPVRSRSEAIVNNWMEGMKRFDKK